MKITGNFFFVVRLFFTNFQILNLFLRFAGGLEFINPNLNPKFHI